MPSHTRLNPADRALHSQKNGKIKKNKKVISLSESTSVFEFGGSVAPCEQLSMTSEDRQFQGRRS